MSNKSTSGAQMATNTEYPNPRYIRIPTPLWERLAEIALSERRAYNTKIIEYIEMGVARDSEQLSTKKRTTRTPAASHA